MPVRIIFRGLILFHLPETGVNAGKLVACLINNSKLTGGFDNASKPNKDHGPHEHHHSAEIQVLSDEDDDHDPKPVLLAEGVNVDIVVPGASQKPVSTAASFDAHVPALETIIERGTDAIRNAGRGRRNLKLIQNVVTVDRGVAHVKKVINWDQDGYPLSGKRTERGGRPGAPVHLKFMGSSVRGHMASEVVVEIDDATEIRLVSTSSKKALKGRRKGPVRPNHRVPLETVEVLVMNYEFRRNGPVAWGLDYQWLFETVGYNAAELGSQEFEDWRAFASRYDRASFESETALLLQGGSHNPVGRPFPYIESESALAPLQPLTDDDNPPVCAFGITKVTVP